MCQSCVLITTHTIRHAHVLIPFPLSLPPISPLSLFSCTINKKKKAINKQTEEICVRMKSYPKIHICLACAKSEEEHRLYLNTERRRMFNHRHLQHFIIAMLVGIYDHHIFDQLKYTLCRIKLHFNVHSGLTLHNVV